MHGQLKVRHPPQKGATGPFVRHFKGCSAIVVRHCENISGKKKSTKINFLGPETARWGGGLPRKGVVAEKFVLSLESLSSLGLEERNLGCPGNFAGISRTPGGVQKVCAKKSPCAFSFPNIRRKCDSSVARQL